VSQHGCSSHWLWVVFSGGKVGGVYALAP
jgi:hypothetical protein